jgi:hypothetical protein
MPDDRTVRQFVDEIDHITGVKVKIWWIPFRGLYLKDTETGNVYALGEVTKRTVLSPGEQESVCRSLFREEWLVLLGLDAPQDDS